jgi:hypothetical protein
MHDVLTSLIQLDTALQGAPNKLAFPFKSAEPSQSKFASTLATASSDRPPAQARWPQPPSPGLGRDEAAEKGKKTPVDSKISTPVVPVLHTVKASSDLGTMLERSPSAAISLATLASIPVFTVDSDSNGAIALNNVDDSGQQIALPGSERQSQTDALTHNATTISAGTLRDAPLQARAPAVVADLVPHEVSLTGAIQAVTLPPVGETSAQPPAIGLNASREEVDGTSASSKTGSATPAKDVALVASELAKKVGSDLLTPENPEQPAVELAVEVAAGALASVNRAAQPSSFSTSLTGKAGAADLGLQRPSLSVLRSSVASELSSADFLKPISSISATPLKAEDGAAVSGARERVASPVQAPANQDHPSTKQPDFPTNSVDVSALPVGLAASAAHAQVNGGDQPGTGFATANVLTQVSSLTNPDSPSRSGSGSAPTPLPPAENSPIPAPVAGAVEIARLVAGVAQSEMHIGLRTQAFGSVELHTTVRDSQVGLTVGSERGDLRGLLATEVSGLQTALRQHDLRFDNIRYLETGTGSGTSSSGGDNSQHRSSDTGYPVAPGEVSFDNLREIPAEFENSAGIQARLSVHA